MKPTEQDGDETIDLRSLILQTILVTVLLVAAVALAGVFLREEITLFAQTLIEEMGVFGLFVGIVLSDAFTFPIPPDTYLFVTVASGGDVVWMLTVCSIGSVFAGNLAFTVGPYLARAPFFKQRIERFRPKGEHLYQTYGIWTVVFAALTPIPFSIVCWFAGIYKMNRGKFFLATLARIPRLVGYYLLFELGWTPV